MDIISNLTRKRDGSKITAQLGGISQSHILGGLKEIEQQLDERNVYERVWLQPKGSLPDDIRIIEYNHAMKKYFNKLNY